MLKRKIVAKFKGVMLSLTTAIASVQIFVSFALCGCDSWDATWLPIQIGMCVLGITWDVLFLVANFPSFERRR